MRAEPTDDEQARWFAAGVRVGETCALHCLPCHACVCLLVLLGLKRVADRTKLIVLASIW